MKSVKAMEEQKLVILNIAPLTEAKGNGVNVVVPCHTFWQNQFEKSAVVNIFGKQLLSHDELRLEYKGADGFPDYLPQPFNAPDLVIFHQVNYTEYLKLYPTLLNRGIPYIILPHGEICREALRKKWLKKKIAYSLFFNRFISKAEAIQCLSELEMISLPKRFHNRKFISTNGFDADKPIKKYGAKSDKMLRLVYIGRLDNKQKGLDKMLKGLAISVNKPNIRLDIYGPDILGRKKKVEKFIAQNGLQEIARIFPPVYGDEKVEILKEADIFIQTSNFEGMPLGILEAMAYGMAVIATVGTTLGEDIERHNCGWNAGNTANSIANAIDVAYENRFNLEDKGKNSADFVAEYFDWCKITNEAIKTYKAIVKGEI